MKKNIIFLLSVLLMLGLAACNTGNNDRAADGETGGRVEIDTDTDSKDEKSDDDKTSAADDESEAGKESGTETETDTGTETDTETETQTDSGAATEDDQKPADDPDKEDPEKDEENPLFKLDLNLETPSVTLPASVGENPFKGKTFTNGEEYRWIFSDQENTVKEEIHKPGREDSWRIYNYSYNAQKNVIYLAFKTSSWGDSSYSSLAEYWEIAKEMIKEMMKENPDKPVSEDMIESTLKSMARVFSTIEVYQYKISEGTIAFIHYYDPACPNYSGFWCFDETEEAGFRTLINFKRGEGLWLWPKGSSGNGDGYHCILPEMKDGQLSGDIYYEDEMIGTLKATYTVSGEGTSDCTMTIKFSELPEIMTDFTTGKEYLLSNNHR